MASFEVNPDGCAYVSWASAKEWWAFWPCRCGEHNSWIFYSINNKYISTTYHISSCKLTPEKNKRHIIRLRVWLWRIYTPLEESKVTEAKSREIPRANGCGAEQNYSRNSTKLGERWLRGRMQEGTWAGSNSARSRLGLGQTEEGRHERAMGMGGRMITRRRLGQVWSPSFGGVRKYLNMEGGSTGIEFPVLGLVGSC